MSCALPSFASLFDGSCVFDGVLTEVGTNSVTVVNYQDQKVVQAFIPANAASKIKILPTFHPGQRVRLKYKKLANGSKQLTGLKGI